MKWNKYKTLTKEQKEEYNYRFNNFFGNNVISCIFSIVLFYMMELVLIVVVMYAHSIDIITEQLLEELALSLNNINMLVTCYIIIYIIYGLIRSIYFLVTYIKWKHTNNL